MRARLLVMGDNMDISFDGYIDDADDLLAFVTESHRRAALVLPNGTSTLTLDDDETGVLTEAAIKAHGCVGDVSFEDEAEG